MKNYIVGALTSIPIFAVGLKDPEVDKVCGGNDFFGFPRWYEYLDINTPEIDGRKVCAPTLDSINDIWLVGLAVIDILLRVIMLLAIFYLMFGGIKYIDARGNADKLNSAKHTTLDAMKGLVIAVAAAAVVSFIGGRFTQ